MESVTVAKVLIYPANNHENQYINIQEKAIKRAGVDVTYSLKELFSTDFLLLNWFETLGGNPKLDYIKKCIKIFLFILLQKKIFWVVHNKQPHAKYSNDPSIELSVKLMKKLLKISSRIIILCDETLEVLKNLCEDDSLYSQKIYKIPHPNYIGVYPQSEEVNNTGGLQFLYVGQVNKYKNVGLLIDVFNELQQENIFLTVVGNCKDRDYADALKSAIKNKNISCNFRFIPDEELVSYIDRSDILVLPYSLESSLNSGTIFLAFSCKRTVVSPLIGTLKEYGEDKSFFYSYEYNSPQEHRERLLAAIRQVMLDYARDSEALKQKGLVAYSLVSEQNSLEQIAERYWKLFAQF